MVQNKFHMTLIRPTFVLPVTSHQAQQGVPSLTLAYLAGTLKKNDILSTCIDSAGEKLGHFHQFDHEGLLAHGLTTDEVVDRIPEDTDLIGVSLMFANEWLYTRSLIKKIRQRFPHKMLIAGGEHVTADYEYILKTAPEIDVCARGEGEQTLIDFITALKENKSWKGIPGLIYRDEEKVHLNPVRERIKDVNSIAWPDWSGLPLRRYLDRGMGNDTQKKRSVPLLASRGCPYQCTFCTSPQMWTTRWTARDPQDLWNEMNSYIQLYHANHFEFYDLTAIINREWIQTFCKIIIESQEKITYSLPTGTRSEALDLATLKLLKESGCLKMTLAPESGSIKTLERIKKRVKPEKLLEVVKNCRKAGLVTKCNMIFGFPGQTKYECFESFLYILKLAWHGANDVVCFSFVPYPGSELFSDLTKKGLIVKDDGYDLFLSKSIYNDTSKLKSWSEHIPDWMMPYLVIGGMGMFFVTSFLLRPHRLAQLIVRLIKEKPVTMLEMLLYGIYQNFILGKKRKVLT